MSGTLKILGLSTLLTLAGLVPGPLLGQVARTVGHPGAPVNGTPRPQARASVQPAGHAVPIATTVFDDSDVVWETEGGASDITWGSPSNGTAGCLPIFGSIEYLRWWSSDTKSPPLVTTSDGGTPRDDAGVLGLNSTTILFGGDQAVDLGTLGGARLTLGLWLDPCQQTSFLGRVFGMEDSNATFNASSDGSDILARPFFNAFTGEQDALLLGFPNEIRGSIQVKQETQTRGAQALFRNLYRSGDNYRWDVVYGYRYLGVDESIVVNNSLEFIDPASNAFGNSIDQLDVFEVENEFHGGELGLMGHSVDGRWSLDFLGTVALGTMRQQATVRGRTVASQQGGDPVTVNGGLLTQGTNIGTYKDDPFTVIPELTTTLGYFVTPRLDFSIGYTFLYVNHVSRPGQIIDTSVNLTQQTGNLQGPARPEFVFKDSDYWLQGLNFGLNLRY